MRKDTKLCLPAWECSGSRVGEPRLTPRLLPMQKSGEDPGCEAIASELIDRKSTWRAMLLLQSLTPMTRTLQSVTVAGMFALVPMVLLPRMRSETYVYFTTQVLQTCYGPCMPWTPCTCCLNLFWAMYSLLNIMKSVVASQNIFLGSPGRKLSFNWKLFCGAHA